MCSCLSPWLLILKCHAPPTKISSKVTGSIQPLLPTHRYHSTLSLRRPGNGSFEVLLLKVLVVFVRSETRLSSPRYRYFYILSQLSFYSLHVGFVRLYKNTISSNACLSAKRRTNWTCFHHFLQRCWRILKKVTCTRRLG